MLIQISITSKQPLIGSASSDGGTPVAFVGWLEMLKVIAELTEAPEPAGAPDASDRAPDEASATQHERDRSLS